MTKTWTGKDAGVRKPMTGETPLSPAEVGVGIRDGAFARGGRQPNYGAFSAALLSMLKAAGEAGVSQAGLRNAVPDGSRLSVSCALMRMKADGRAIRRGKGKTIHWWIGTVPVEVIDAAWATMFAAVLAERQERMRRNGRNGNTRTRRKRGQMTMAEYREAQRVKREARDQRIAAERERDAQARAAIRQERMDARKLAADLQALEAKEAAAKAKKRANKAIKKATANINRIADKYRGVNAPSTVPMPQARPKATPVEIPPHLVTVCRPMTLPHERIQPTGSFGRIGQYDTEPGHVAVALGVAA